MSISLALIANELLVKLKGRVPKEATLASDAQYTVVPSVERNLPALPVTLGIEAIGDHNKLVPSVYKYLPLWPLTDGT